MFCFLGLKGASIESIYVLILICSEQIVCHLSAIARASHTLIMAQKIILIILKGL